MSPLPLKAILFWIAVTLATAGHVADSRQRARRNVGLDETNCGLEPFRRPLRLERGRKHRDNVNQGKGEENRRRTSDEYVRGIKDHDWKESATLKLPSGASLAKEGETYVYTLDEGNEAAKRYVIRFRRNPAAAKGVVQLGYVGETSDDKRSFADSGHAIAFDRPADAKYLAAIQIYASRYGLPQPPKEDFHVYVLDKDRKVVQDFLVSVFLDRPRPAAMVHARPAGDRSARAILRGPGVQCAADQGDLCRPGRSVKESHSYSGLPGDGYQPVRGKVRLDGAGAAGFRPETGQEPARLAARASSASDGQRVREGLRLRLRPARFPPAQRG